MVCSISNPDGWPCNGAVHVSNSRGGPGQEFSVKLNNEDIKRGAAPNHQSSPD